MINEKQARRYCREDITLIKNYAEAVADKTQTWICHHINAEPFTGFCTADLEKMNMYENRPASELKFVTRKMHVEIHGSGHTGKHHYEETRQKISASLKDIKREPRSEFGKKFKEHYDMTSIDNSKLYQKEYRYYRHNGKCSWE